MSDTRRIILGIDPGLALMGYGVVAAVGETLRHVDHGCITTAADRPTALRLRTLYEGLLAVRQRHAVTDVAMESLFYSRNVRTAMAVGQARGVALLATVDDLVEFGEYTPTEVKRVVSGYGAAVKRQVQEMVRLSLCLSEIPTPDDAADALAVAICHARQPRFSRIVGRA